MAFSSAATCASVADTVRPEARHAIEEFDRMRIGTLLLTGDAKPWRKISPRSSG